MDSSSLNAGIRPATTEVPQSRESRYDEFHRARDLNLSQLAQQLAKLAGTALEETKGYRKSLSEIDAPLVRRLIAARQVRAEFLPAGLIADPVWDMMLDLTAAQLEGKLVSVSSLCIASAVPTTTALRAITALVHSGLLERHTDSSDARRAFISLSNPMYETMLACVSKIIVIIGT